MFNIGIGKIIETTRHRDAIHIAVAPCIAGEDLEPGQHISIKDGKAYLDTDNPIGIVDPFLHVTVLVHQKFYVFIYPGTTTSLRHEWEHPSFSQSSTVIDKVKSELWLRKYASEVNNNCSNDEEAFELLMTGLKTGELTYYGTDMHFRSDLINETELQYHASIVIGKQINFDNFNFSCSC